MQNRIDALIKKGIENPKDFESELASLEHLSDEEKKQLRLEFQKSLNSKGQEIKRLTVRAQLEDIADIVNLSYIAKHYFGKSRQWLSNRLNESTVNGKPATFTPSQISTLNEALKDISKRIGSLSVIQ